MIRVFICPECGKVRLVSKFLKADCYQCGAEMRDCGIPYTEWVDMSMEERAARASEMRRTGSLGTKTEN